MNNTILGKLLDLPIFLLVGMYLIFLFSTIYDYSLN